MKSITPPFSEIIPYPLGVPQAKKPSRHIRMPVVEALPTLVL
jgi:hypothetical protein